MDDGLTSKEVEAVRTSLKLSRRDFALRLRVSVETVRSWETGRRPCRGPYAQLVRALGVWGGSR